MVQAIYANAWVRQSYQQAAGRKVNPTSSLHKRAYAATAVPVRRRHAMKVPERINSAEAVVERKVAQRTRQANAQPLNQARDKCGCREQLDLASAQLDVGKSAHGS